MKKTAKHYLHASLKPILIILIAASSSAIFTCSALADSSPVAAQPVTANPKTINSSQQIQGPQSASNTPAKEIIVNVDINPAITLKNITTTERMIMVNPAAMLCSPGARIDVMRLIIATNNRSGRDPLNQCIRFTSVPTPVSPPTLANPTVQATAPAKIISNADAPKHKAIPIKHDDPNNVLQHAVNTKDLVRANAILVDGDDIVIMGAS